MVHTCYLYICPTHNMWNTKSEPWGTSLGVQWLREVGLIPGGETCVPRGKAKTKSFKKKSEQEITMSALEKKKKEVNPKVNYDFWVIMMCQRRFIDY